MIPVFKSKGVYGHIDGTDLCPPPSRPNYDAWVQIDYQILSWIHATISTDILQMIIQPGLDAEYSVAKRTIPHRSPFPSFVELQSLLLIEESTLQREKSTSAFPFVNSNAQQVLQTSIHSSGMGSSIPEVYYSGTQSRPDFYGMNRGRGSFVAVVTNEVVEAVVILVAPSQILIHSSYGHPSSHFRGSSLPPLLPNPSMASPHVTACQLCDQLTHKARDCPLLIGTNIASMSSALTALTATTFPTAPDSKWYIDSGANTHVSSAPGNLSHSSPYSGSEFIQDIHLKNVLLHCNSAVTPQNLNPRRDRRRALVRRIPQVHKARNLSNSQSDTTKSQDKILQSALVREQKGNFTKKIGKEDEEMDSIEELKS
ncbi:hypothetical protein SLEP1_g25705 [Rubroshorea leprosula]|uniref:Uncharacterized protein n=1 Tax=Rubroshorea leprosula TaxID=152421 RepID=A0AAV5JUB6_9ROSI|nr:hypothetical protein SLEP1_g25705 [Rubroshorea leprosula]